jgi:hypothetical protein
VNFSNSFCGTPFAACLFNTTLQLGFQQLNTQTDDGWFFRRRPAGFFDNYFDSSEAFAPLLVVAIADADQLFAVAVEELLCAFLTGSQCPPSLDKRAS